MKLSAYLFLGLLFLYSQQVTSEQSDEFDDEDDATTTEDNSPELNVPSKEKPVYKAPEALGDEVYLAEPFLSERIFDGWIKSKAKKDDADSSISKYDGQWIVEEAGETALKNDLSLVLSSKAQHHAISTKLNSPYKFTDRPFIVQYEVKFQEGQDCGGAYVKLLTEHPDLDLTMFRDKTQYTIMFGPDKCGNDAKIHFIFQHLNPITKKYEEKHAKKSTFSDSIFTDKKTHLFTLVINPDNTFEILVDQAVVNSGDLLKDMTPPVNPEKEITDPNDKKPQDWDDKEKISDPNAVKPEDWDEDQPEKITDPDATKPEGWLDNEQELISDPDADKPKDWDDDMDGEWEAPMINNPLCESAPGCGEWKAPEIKNPKYKGKWRAPMISNPNYSGVWKPRKIPNPDYFEDNNPYKMSTIQAIGLELWSMSNGIAFDNFIVTSDRSIADKFAADSWSIKQTQELASSSGKSVVDSVLDMTKERPWLWAVFIFVIILPIILIIAYCCMSGSSKTDDIAARKKTDAASPDDATVSDSNNQFAESESRNPKTSAGAGEPLATKSSSPKKSKSGKSALNMNENSNNSQEDEDEDVDEAEEEMEEEEQEEPEQAVRSSPRLRKQRARKE